MSSNIALRPSYWASVSGGKDSLYMLKVIFDNPDKYPLDGVIHFKLEIDYPFIEDVCKMIKEECNKRGVRYVDVTPDKTWQEYYDKYGFPTRVARWCQNHYKASALKKHKEFLKSQGYYLVSYIGYCLDEEKRWGKHSKNETLIYPLVNEGIVEKDILKWASNLPIYNHFYKLFKRCGCMKCPMCPVKEYGYQYLFYRDAFEETMRQAKETEVKLTERYGKQSNVFSGQEKYTADYFREVAINKWSPRILKELEEINSPQSLLDIGDK